VDSASGVVKFNLDNVSKVGRIQCCAILARSSYLSSLAGGAPNDDGLDLDGDGKDDLSYDRISDSRYCDSVNVDSEEISEEQVMTIHTNEDYDGNSFKSGKYYKGVCVHSKAPSKVLNHVFRFAKNNYNARSEPEMIPGAAVEYDKDGNPKRKRSGKYGPNGEVLYTEIEGAHWLSWSNLPWLLVIIATISGCVMAVKFGAFEQAMQATGMSDYNMMGGGDQYGRSKGGFASSYAPPNLFGMRSERNGVTSSSFRTAEL